MLNKRLSAILAIPALAGFLTLAGCADSGTSEAVQSTDTSLEQSESTQQDNNPATSSFFAMDTVMELTAYGENASSAVEKGEELVRSIENELSTEIENSTISKLNRDKSVEAEGETFNLLKRASDMWTLTDGAFNISLYPLMKEWGFISQDYKIPDDNIINNILSNTDISEIDIDEDTGKITFENEEMEIDLGGIAKGYTSDSLISLFRDTGITSGMVNLGGNVQLLGLKPDGSPWRVGIRSPYEDVDFLGILTGSDAAVITSGGYERFFEQDGNYYHHIMDPETGYPADNGLISVTIVSDDATLADALSTSLYVMGKDKAISFWQEHSEDFDAILMDDEDKLYVSEGIYDTFTSDTYDITKIQYAD